jgi:anti-sigma factor RsiW
MSDTQKQALDCTDIKAMLSALIDDEADDAERYRAERHLAGCKACRDLISEAERNAALVAAAVAGDDLPGGTPAGFEAAVLARATGVSPVGAARRWTVWLGWFTAAAVILLSAALWWLDRPPAVTGPLAIPGPAARSTWIRPVVNEVAQYPMDAPVVTAPRSTSPFVPPAGPPRTWRVEEPAPTAVSSLTRDDAETLEGVSLLLAMVRLSADDGFAGIERARQVIEYDELLPRLSAARANLPAEDRPLVLAAESMLYRIARGPLSVADVREMRQTITRLDLPQQIEAISGRWPSAASL